MLQMMSENIARNMYSSQGTINFPTQLHLVGHFVKMGLGSFDMPVTTDQLGERNEPHLDIQQNRLEYLRKLFTRRHKLES